MDWGLVQKALNTVEKRIDAVLDIKPSSNGTPGTSAPSDGNVLLGDNDWGWDPEFGSMPVHVSQGGQATKDIGVSLEDVTASLSSMNVVSGVKAFLGKSAKEKDVDQDKQVAPNQTVSSSHQQDVIVPVEMHKDEKQNEEGIKEELLEKTVETIVTDIIIDVQQDSQNANADTAAEKNLPKDAVNEQKPTEPVQDEIPAVVVVAEQVPVDLSPKVPSETKESPSVNQDDSEELRRLLAKREDQLMKASQEIASLHARLSSVEVVQTNSPADDKIKSLIDEATYYNKENVRLTTLLKKSKQKEDELKTTLTSLEKKFVENKTATATLQERLDSVTNNERALKDNLRAQKEKEEEQSSRIFDLESELAKTKDLFEQTKANLDRVYNENNDLRARQDEGARQAQSERLEAEVKRSEALVLQCDQIQRQADKQQAVLQKEISELRAALTRAQDDLGWKEDQFQKEISSLNARLLASTQHADSISASLHTSTAPLLRQIETIQSQFDNARGSWDALERHLTGRVRDLERELDRTKGKEREWNQERGDLEHEKERVERVLEEARKEVLKLRQQVEVERLEVEKMKTEMELMREREVKMNHEHHRSVESVRSEMDLRVKEAVERERRIWEEKFKAEEKKMMEREREMEKQRVRTTMMRRMSTDNNSSEPSPSLSAAETTSRNVDVQIMTLQEQLKMAIQARDEIASELVKVSAELASFQPDIQVAKLQEEMEKLQEQHTSALELLGEKTEQVEELKHDIQDMREAYRVQIQELVDKLNRQSSV